MSADCRFKLLKLNVLLSRLIAKLVKSVTDGGAPNDGLTKDAAEGVAATIDLTSCAFTGNLEALIALTTPKGVSLPAVMGMDVETPPLMDKDRLKASPKFKDCKEDV